MYKIIIQLVFSFVVSLNVSAAIEWPVEKPDTAVGITVNDSLYNDGSYDADFWWEGGFLWVKITPRSPKIYICPVRDYLSQGGVMYVFHFLSEVENFCGELDHPMIFMVSSGLRYDLTQVDDGIPVGNQDTLISINNNILSIPKSYELSEPPEPNSKLLRVYRDGTGDGYIINADNSIMCAHKCRANIKKGQSVGLVAIPAVGSKFLRWGQACSGKKNNRCNLKMNSNKWVSAFFKDIKPKNKPKNPAGNPEPDYEGPGDLCGSVIALRPFLGAGIVPSGCYGR